MRRKLFAALALLCMTVSLAGCSLLGKVESVEPITEINTSYQSQLNPTQVVANDAIIMADETIPLEFDGPTWTELREKYGLSVPITETTVIEKPLPDEPVEQLDSSGLLETLAIETPMKADDGKEYILIKGQWYLFDKENGVKAYVNNKCDALNFRVGPSVGNAIITSYRTNAEVKIFKAAHMSDNSTWYYVKQANGDTGWQHSYYLNIADGEKIKPATTDILELIKPTEKVEVITIVNHDASGHLKTRKYTEVGPAYLETGYTFIAPTRLWCYNGAGYTNDRIMSVEAGTVLQVLGKAEMSNGLTWYRVKWQVEVDVVDTEETEGFERVEKETAQITSTPTPVENEEVTAVTTLPSWQKVMNGNSPTEDDNVVAADIIKYITDKYSTGTLRADITNSADMDGFECLEGACEDQITVDEYKNNFFTELDAEIAELDGQYLTDFNVIVKQLDNKAKEGETFTNIYVIFNKSDEKPAEKAPEPAPTPEAAPTQKPDTDEETGMVKVIKEYTGYIDYNVEKLLGVEEIRDMYGLMPTATPTPTATPIPTAKPTKAPSSYTPTYKPTATHTPKVESGMAAVPYSASEITGSKTMTVNNVVKAFKNAGFTNVTKESKYYDPNVGQPEGTVYDVEVANSRWYSKGDTFYKDAKVVVYYYTRVPSATDAPKVTPTPTPRPVDPNVCKSPYSAGEFTNSTGATLYINDVERAYKKAGFTNVNIFADPYNPQIGQPEGMVYSVEIGGSTSFTTETTYYKDSVVNIHYYTRKGISGTGTQDSDDVDKVSSPLASTVFTDNSNASQYLLDTTLSMFTKAGFTNISTFPVHYDATIGQPEGMVKYIEIAGSRNYTLSNKFYKDAEVVIYYYTRKPVTPYTSKESMTKSITQLVQDFEKAGFSKKNIEIYGSNLAENEYLLDEYGNVRPSIIYIAYKTRENGYLTTKYADEFKKDAVFPSDAKLQIYPENKD